MSHSVEERLSLSKEVQLYLGTTGASLPVANDLGRHFVVTALGHESCADLFARIERVGGYANVFVQVFGRVFFVPFTRAEFAPGEPPEAVCMPFDSESEISMLVEYLLQSQTGVTLYLSGSQRVPTVARDVHRVDLLSSEFPAWGRHEAMTETQRV